MVRDVVKGQEDEEGWTPHGFVVVPEPLQEGTIVCGCDHQAAMANAWLPTQAHRGIPKGLWI